MIWIFALGLIVLAVLYRPVRITALIVLAFVVGADLMMAVQDSMHRAAAAKACVEDPMPPGFVEDNDPDSGYEGPCPKQ